jgi:hypothetical protein
MESKNLFSKIRLNYQSICLFAHPGHELAILHTLSQLKPIIHILTNGGGRHNRSRISYTDKVIDQIGAVRGEILGRLSDLEAYNLFKDQLTDQIIDLAEEVISYFSRHQKVCIISDAFEGYNPTHDLVATISQQTVYQLREMGREVIHLSFSPILADKKDLAPTNYNRGATLAKNPIHCQQLDKKIRIVEDYTPLQPEIESLFVNFDHNYETLLWHQDNHEIDYPSIDWHPFWEKYSQDKVRQGHYAESLNYKDNFFPILENLLNTKIRAK